MHASYIRPGGVSYDAYGPIKRYYDFLQPFSTGLTDIEELLCTIVYLKSVS